MDTGEGWSPSNDFSTRRRDGAGYGQPNAKGPRGQPWATGYFDSGNGWGNGHQGGVDHGGGDSDDMYSSLNTDSFIRTDPGDFRQLVTNTVAFNHLWRTE